MSGTAETWPGQEVTAQPQWPGQEVKQPAATGQGEHGYAAAPPETKPPPPETPAWNPVGDELGNIYTPSPPPSLDDIRSALPKAPDRPPLLDPSEHPDLPFSGDYGQAMPPDAARAIVGAAGEGWQATPSILTPETQAYQDQFLWGKYFVNPLFRVANAIPAATNALMYGGAELANQITGDPRAGRDALMIAQVAPVAHIGTGVPPVEAPVSEAASAPRPQFVSERTAPDVSGLDPRNAIQTLIQHDIEENPPPAPDRGAANQTTPPEAPSAIVTPSTLEAVTSGSTPSPDTSAYAKQVASAYYDIADKTGGTLTPQFTNKFLDSVSTMDKQTEAGQATAGQNAVSSLLDRWQVLRDKPLTLQAAQEMDEALGGLISKEYGVKGLSPDGVQLLQVQQQLRDQISNAGEGDVTGGSAGFAALDPARKAWAQAMKMGDLERIAQRAEMFDNPATSIKTQVRTLVNNPARSRGYSPDELAAVKDAGDRGFVGGALHVFGSRLLPLVAGGAGLSHGPVAGLISAGVAQPVASMLRAGATGIATRRLNRAIGVVGEGIPPHPLAPSEGQFIPPPPWNQFSPPP